MEINIKDIATLDLIIAVLSDEEWTLEHAQNLRNEAIVEKAKRISNRPHNRLKKAAAEAKASIPSVKIVIEKNSNEEEK